MTQEPEFLAEPAGGKFLQVGVDRQLDGAAAAVGLGFELADQLAARGQLDPLAAGHVRAGAVPAFFQALPCRS